jgi:hypothetical protein
MGWLVKSEAFGQRNNRPFSRGFVNLFSVWREHTDGVAIVPSVVCRSPGKRTTARAIEDARFGVIRPR